MKKHILCLILFTASAYITANCQDFVWADNFHGNEEQVVSSITTNEDLNVYSTVIFYNSLDADPGAGTHSLTSAGSQDIAIVKTDADGNFIWADHLGSTLFETAARIICDSDNNIYIIGYFKGTLDFDPSPAIHALTTAGIEDAFLAKYDSDGNYLWAIQIGSTGGEESYDVETDADNNVYLCGYFQNTIDFNPDAAVFNMTAIGGTANFFLKLSPAGNFIWAKQIAYTFLNGISLDNDANIYVTGGLYGTVDFDPGAATHNLTGFGFGEDIYVAKYNADGNYVWAEQMSGPSDEFGKDVLYDTAQNAVYVSGYFAGTVDFDPGAGITNKISAGGNDAFVMRLQTDGDLVWIKTFGNAGNDNAFQLQTSDNGDLHFGGVFTGTLDLDPSASVFSRTSAGSTDMYFAWWDADGNFIDAKSSGGTLEDDLHALHIDKIGAVYTGGFFDGIVDFDPGAGSAFLNSAFTGWDGYLAKYCTTYSITNTASICTGDSIFAGGAWQHDAGTYYDYFTPVEGCDSTIITIVSVAEPVLDLGPDINACTGDAITLDAGNPDAEFNWSTGAETQLITVTETGTYDVLVSYAGGCGIRDTISITFHDAPEVYLGGDTGICAGTSLLLDAENPGASYHWTGGETTQLLSVTEAGNYFVQVTNIYGCSETDMKHVDLYELPVITLPLANDICEGDSILLDAENSGSAFLWNTGDTTQSIYADEAGIFTVSVINTNGCHASDTISIIMHALPVVDIGDDLEICAGEFAVLDADNTGSDFSWSNGDDGQTITVTEEDDYTVTVTDIHGCSSTDEMHLYVNALPNVNLGDDRILCEGSATVLDAENAGSIFNWNTGSEEQSISVSDGGVYTVIVQDGITGCKNSDTILITSVALPDVSIIYNGDDTLCLDSDPVSLTGLPSGGEFTGEGMSSALFEPAAAGTGSHNILYTYTDENGCTNTASLLITVEVCSAISDNEDKLISVFPNPAIDILNVSLPAGTKSFVSLCDIAGSIIYEEETTGNMITLNTASYPAGIYLLKIVTGTSAAWLQQVMISR